MITTETPTAPTPKPAKRKAARRRAPAVTAEPKRPSEFAGITTTDCCDGCSADKCVISGMNVCAHPMKGGLQSALLSNAEVMKRHKAAKTLLAHAKLDG